MLEQKSHVKKFQNVQRKNPRLKKAEIIDRKGLDFQFS